MKIIENITINSKDCVHFECLSRYLLVLQFYKKSECEQIKYKSELIYTLSAPAAAASSSLLATEDIPK